jgi:hypothetical protein
MKIEADFAAGLCAEIASLRSFAEESASNLVKMPAHLQIGAAGKTASFPV